MDCARLLIVATQSSHLIELPKSTKVKSHGNNVRDIIIVHVISADTQTKIYTGRHRKHKVILGPAAVHKALGQLVKKVT